MTVAQCLHLLSFYHMQTLHWAPRRLPSAEHGEQTDEKTDGCNLPKSEYDYDMI